MTTATALIQRTLRKLTVLGRGKTITADQLADGLEELNAMLQSWSASGWMIPYRTRDEAIAIATSKSKYTIGSGGDFNVARPIRIDAITLYSGNTPYTVEERSQDAFNAQSTGSGGTPEFFYYEPTYPLGSIYFDSQPGTGLTVTIDSLKPLSAIADGDDEVTLPPGYDDAIVYMLAPRLAPEYGKTLPQEALFLAQRSEDFIRTQNNLHRKAESQVDAALLATGGRGYSVINDR